MFRSFPGGEEQAGKEEGGKCSCSSFVSLKINNFTHNTLKFPYSD